MTFDGNIAPVARVAGFSAADLTWVLVIVGVDLVIGNTLGGRTADTNLRLSLIQWPAAMIASLIVAGFVAPFKWPFLAAAFVFGVTSCAAGHTWLLAEDGQSQSLLQVKRERYAPQSYCNFEALEDNRPVA
jgi:predicted MFS family arabinose efflux permease